MLTDMQASLTQQEIDALLSILPADGSPLPGSNEDFVIGSVRAYDFRSPDKFSKEQIRTLEMIHENFARRVGSSLSAYLRTTVHLACVHVEQGSFADFIQNVPTPSPIAVFRMDPLPGRVLLTLDTTVATILVDRLLGGFGRPANDGHQITDIEQSLLRGILQQLADGLQQAWKNLIALQVVLEEAALNPEFVQVALPTDATIFLGFDITVRQHTGMLNVCIPYSVLKPIVTELSPRTWAAGEARENGSHRQTMLHHLQHAQIEVSVLLGEVTVDFEDLLHLQAGDVLVLDAPVNRPLPVLVGDSAKYLGQPGLAGRYVAVQITQTMENSSYG